MPNIAGLAATRALCGMGFAVACPAATGVIGSAFPAGRIRTAAFAALSGSAALGHGLGLLCAGLLGNIKWVKLESHRRPGR